MARRVKVAFASCTRSLLEGFVERFSEIAPDAELIVVSEFPPPRGQWIAWRVDRSFGENIARCRAALSGTRIEWAALIMQPGAPYRRLRAAAFLIASPVRVLLYNTNYDHFPLRPSGLPALARHALWRLRERVAFESRPGGNLYTWLWRLKHPSHLRRPVAFAAALAAGRLALARGPLPSPVPPLGPELPEGITVVIPSRNGRGMLERLVPLISADEIIIVDNGSNDGTGDAFPAARVIATPEPLSFADAVNRGIFAARFSHVCLLNNDMIPRPGFLAELRAAFDRVPDLFCATAQIHFPEGKRREETGKAVMRPPVANRTTTELPVHCIEPIPGEDLTYVLYGSGGCSLYDTRKLRALGGIDESYRPAYVEDLDIGVRGWQAGWPTVFAANASTVHEHRATTSRYFSETELQLAVERNYLRFVTGTARSWRLWRDAIVRLNLKAAFEHDPAALSVLQNAWRMPVRLTIDEPVLAIGTGDVAVFPGRARANGPTVLIASCYPPWPLSHGGAVRMYNLMRRAAAGTSQVLLAFVDELATPAEELLDICVEVVLVLRVGSHVRPDTGRPDVVEEFDNPCFAAVMREMLRKWRPSIVQLEFTQMAQYAQLAAPAKTVLVEHDITMDLYRQLLTVSDDWDLRRQFERWQQFETRAWKHVDCVVTMSQRDANTIVGGRRVAVLRNGVDLQRYSPADAEPDAARLLFIGSFAHLPNLLALDFFLNRVWPLLPGHRPVLHVIAGSQHEFHFERARDRVAFSLNTPGLELEGFVADVRPAYRRATIVIAPLLVSAGTNIKIMEAMAMGKAIVSTAAGINGLDELAPGEDVIVQNEPEKQASAIAELLASPARRRELERSARATAERVYDWDTIAAAQQKMYTDLLSG